MTVSETKLSELADLLARLCDSELDRPEWERLDALLLDDTDAQEFYRRFIALDVNLAWRGADRAASGPADAPTPERFLAKKESRPASSALPVTLPSDRAALVVGSSSIFGSLLGSPALAYAVTALVLALGIIGARLWSPPGNGQQLVAGDVLPPPTVAARGPVVVGRITAMSDCQWANPQTAPREGESVFQGRSFLLNSGLLEISYDIGTKAILEGPAVYKVDAANGGSLFFGKVTVHAGKVARPAAVAGGRAEGAGHGQVAATGRLTPPPRAAAFCVRTGSALVKNTGEQDAQFGVEVDRSWATYLHVLRGLVTIRSAGFEPQAVPAGMCVWTGAGANHDNLLIFRPGTAPAVHPASRSFVTEMPKSTRAGPAGT